MKTNSFMLIVALAASAAVLPLTGSCQCVTPFEVGSWKNDDPATRGITHLEVTFTCQDQVLNGELYPPGPPFHLHLFGKCSPTDCDWGTVGGNRVTIGTTDWIHSFYDHGFARRYVYIKPSTLVPGHLFLWMYTDFVDPGRADYIFTGWFHK